MITFYACNCICRHLVWEKRKPWEKLVSVNQTNSKRICLWCQINLQITKAKRKKIKRWLVYCKMNCPCYRLFFLVWLVNFYIFHHLLYLWFNNWIHENNLNNTHLKAGVIYSFYNVPFLIHKQKKNWWSYGETYRNSEKWNTMNVLFL
jgi:hypothetical protein